MNEIFTGTFDRWTWFPQMKPWELEVMSSNKKVQRMKDRQLYTTDVKIIRKRVETQGLTDIYNRANIC